MAHQDPSSPAPMPTILRYCIAVLSVAIAIGLDFFLLQHFEAIFDAVPVSQSPRPFGTQERGQVCSQLSSQSSALITSSYIPFFSSPISYADLVYLTFCTFCALAVGRVSRRATTDRGKSFVRPTRSSTPKSAPSKDAVCASLSDWGCRGLAFLITGGGSVRRWRRCALVKR